jgi:hypothetical protein
MTTAVPKRWPLLRVLLTAHLTFTAILWVLFTVLVIVATGIVAAAGGVSESVLHHAATQAPRWLMFGLGIDVISTYLRIQLAHGRTRREFTGQAVGYTVILSGFSAVLVTLGYLLERGVYAVFGWPQKLSRGGLFTAADQYPAIFGTYWLIFLMWTVAGLVIGLGFFRSPGLGLLTIPLGLAIVLPSVTATRNSGMPIFGDELADLEFGAATVLGASAALFVLGVGLFWAIVRTVPMKSKAT